MMRAVVLKIFRATADITSAFFHGKADIKTRLQVASALIKLKLLGGKTSAGEQRNFVFFHHPMSVFHPGDVQFMIKEIWLEQPYRIPAKYPLEHIVDLGANQGFSFLYFKQQHPGARITAIEADPQNFRVLLQNTLGIRTDKDVFIAKAAWNKDGVLHMAGGEETPSTNRSFAEDGEIKSSEIPAFDFAAWLLQHPADLVKMDIEGAEAEVMDAVIAAGALQQAAHWFIEFHTERFGHTVHQRVREAFEAAGFQYENRGIIGYFFRSNARRAMISGADKHV